MKRKGLGMSEFIVDVEHSVKIPCGHIHVDGQLFIPKNASGLVLFVHGSGSSRFSVRNQAVARILNQANIATLLFDLFTPEEDEIDSRTGQLRFDIEFLASRLIEVTDWCVDHLVNLKSSIGYFGASTGGGAALVAAAKRAKVIKVVVSRGGRPDLAGESLAYVKAPTLLIVGGNDGVVIEMNQTAMSKLNCEKKLEIVADATHLFEEPGALDKVAQLARAWFLRFIL